MTDISHTAPSPAAPSFDPAALDAAYRAVGCELRAEEFLGRRTLSFFTLSATFPPEHRSYTPEEKAALIAYLDAQGRVKHIPIGPGVTIIPKKEPRLPTDEQRESQRRLVRLMCDTMRGNKGKTFYVATETNVSTFVIPDHLYERERQAYYRISNAYQIQQNVVGFGVVKQYM